MPLVIGISGLRWLFSLAFGGLHNAGPESLLNVAPLRKLLTQKLEFNAIDTALSQHALKALGVTASNYRTTASVTFFHARKHIEPWSRARRTGVASRIGVEHILGSAALPVIFPAERIGSDYFGDGSLRTTAPRSPAIRFGAERLLIIGMHNEQEKSPSTVLQPYPSFGELGGYLLDILFVNNLNTDIERLQRINVALSVMNAEQIEATGLRHIEALAKHPSQDLFGIARKYINHMPWTIRAVLRELEERDSS